MVTQFKEAIEKYPDPRDLSSALHDILKDVSKAEFALELLWLREPTELKVPSYIRNGLAWLESQIRGKQETVATPAPDSQSVGDK